MTVPGLVVENTDASWSTPAGERRHTDGAEAASAASGEWDGEPAELRRAPKPEPGALFVAAGHCGCCAGLVDTAGHCRCSA